MLRLLLVVLLLVDLYLSLLHNSLLLMLFLPHLRLH